MGLHSNKFSSLVNEGQPQQKVCYSGRDLQFSSLVNEGQPQPAEISQRLRIKFSSLVNEGQPQPNIRAGQIEG